MYSFGPNWWKVDMLMNCDQTYDSEGWFELKAYVTNRGWESDINQVSYNVYRISVKVMHGFKLYTMSYFLELLSQF